MSESVAVDREPDVVYGSRKHGDVEIYTSPDTVLVDGEKIDRSPKEMVFRTHGGESYHYSLISGDPTSVFDPDELVRVESPYRPLPLSARTELKEDYDVVKWIDADATGRNGGVILTERPAEELLVENELEVIRDPDVVYHTDHDEIVEIYTDPDKVVTDGVESSGMSPQEAVEIAENQDRFTREEGEPESVLSET